MGTQALEALLPDACPVSGKQSLPKLRSQAELGNEKKAEPGNEKKTGRKAGADAKTAPAYAVRARPVAKPS